MILYIRGKENGEMLKDSIDNGPYQFKQEITVKDTDGTTDIKRPQILDDLTPEEKLRYDSVMKAINILLLGLLLYAFLKHNEKDAKEVREMRQRFPKPLALLTNTYNLSHPDNAFSAIDGGFGLSDCARGEVIGVMGSGEGYGLAVEWTRDSGLELETVGKAGMVLARRYKGPWNKQIVYCTDRWCRIRDGTTLFPYGVLNGIPVSFVARFGVILLSSTGSFSSPMEVEVN
ncbi:hypothetical protein Tco_0205635 [Tanacetum coccineum]